MYDTILLRTELAIILMHIVLFYDQMKKSYTQVNSRLQKHLKIIFMLAKIANASENVVEFFFFFAFGPIFVYWNHCYKNFVLNKIVSNMILLRRIQKKFLAKS